MLGEWIDALERLIATGTFPIGQELDAMQLCPFADEPELAVRERAGKHISIEVDGRNIAAVLSGRRNELIDCNRTSAWDRLGTRPRRRSPPEQ
jgi:hypothetical protein